LNPASSFQAGTAFQFLIRSSTEDARDLSLWRLNRVNSKVTRTMHRPVQPLFQSPGLPESCISKAVSAMKLRVASILTSFGSPGARTSRPCSSSQASQCGCELPRALHLRTLPAMDLRVASNFASFGASSGEAPGCPSASVHPLRLSMSHRVSPAPASSGVAGDGASSCPESRILRRYWT
jgi:hypothetical protein